MEEIQEKIFELYIQRLSGTLTADEEQYVQQQLQEDAAFRTQWEQLERTGTELDANNFLQRINSAEVLETIREVRTPGTGRKVFALKRVLAAASLLLLLGAGGYLFFILNPGRKAATTAGLVKPPRKAIRLTVGQGQTVELNHDSTSQTISLNNTTLNNGNGSLKYTSTDTTMNMLDVPAGSSYRLTLSDGTEVWLNAATRLRFPFHFGTAAREVFVEGEAFFKVAKNAGHPFIVRTPLTSVQVMGTSFNVNTYQAGVVKTALVDGKVITRNKENEQVTLLPGMESRYGNGKGFSSSHFDEEEVLAWRNGIYYYYNMPIPRLIEEASRFYGVRFIADKSSLDGKTVTGLMDRNRLEDFLSDLKTTAHIHYEASGNVITLK